MDYKHLLCDDDEDVVDDAETPDFDKFVKSRTKTLTTKSYQTPPTKKFKRRRARKWSSNDSGVHNKAGRPASRKLPRPCGCNKEVGDVKLSDVFTPCSEDVKPLYRPFDSLPWKDLLVSWQEKFKRQERFLGSLGKESEQYSGKERKDGDVLKPVSQAHEEKSRKAGLDYITEAKNYVKCSDKTIYLAIKYFNAYIVRNNSENWGRCNCSILLLSSTCLMLADRLEEYDHPDMTHALGIPKYLVTEMEFEVRESCDWRLWLATPFEVLDIIVREKADNAMDRNDLYSRASKLIFAFGMTNNGLVEVAFAGLLAVTHGQSVTKEQIEECVLPFKQYIDVDPLSCLDIIHKMGNAAVETLEPAA